MQQDQGTSEEREQSGINYEPARMIEYFEFRQRTVVVKREFYILCECAEFCIWTIRIAFSFEIRFRPEFFPEG